MNRRIVVKNDAGDPIETPQECFWRVAWVVAGGSFAENLTQRKRLAVQYYDLMASRKFLPNSPCLVNAGRPLGQLSACFVLPVPDSIEGIYGAVGKAAKIHQSGGGTGFSFSRIRAAGSPVLSTNGVASGPVTFMEVFDKGTWAIKQGATRRGANMGMLHINHPDIWEFINLKGQLDPATGLTRLENFNISVAITDAFMDSVREAVDDPAKDQPWLSSGHTVLELWDRLCDNAWRTGDPGLIFIDRVNRGLSNPVPSLGPIEATNPCGEQPLYPYDSCNLGSINLAAHMDATSTIDYAMLAQTVRLAVQFLDDVITMNVYPLPEIDDMTKNIRRIGLGVMGWADYLIAKDIPYDSSGALEVADYVADFINTQALIKSQDLGAERGSFPMHKQSVYAHMTHVRNATRTTIAPTGTISIIAGCSGGIEPIYAPVFKRRHHLDREHADAWFEMYELHPEFERFAKRYNLDQQQLDDLADGRTTITQMVASGDLGGDALIFKGANEINVEAHVSMQAAWQNHTNNAVSKTINMPNTARPADVQHAYLLAYELKCNGITIYRDGSRSVQVLGGQSTTPIPQSSIPQPVANPIITPGMNRRRMPDERASITHKFRVGEQEGYMTVGLFADGTPGEIFINMSKQGSTISGLMDTIGMLASYALQYGVPLDELTAKLRNVRFDPSGPTNNRSIPFASSIIDYVFNWLETKFLNTEVPATDLDPDPNDQPTASRAQISVSIGQLCPDCGNQLMYTEGCNKCFKCGYSTCM